MIISKNILVLGMFLLSICSYGQEKISATKAYDALKNTNKIQLLDVRTTAEYDSKHIAKSIHIDWNNKEVFEENIEAKLNKKQPVYVYCLSGGRSAQAAKLLVEKGYTIYEIDGGILKWEAAKLPLEVKPSELKGLNLQKFKEAVKSDNIILVDFYATWCGPCKELDPILKQVVKKHADKVSLLKIDVDQNSILVQQLGISSIPALHLYKGGKLIWKHSGLIDQQSLEKQL